MSKNYLTVGARFDTEVYWEKHDTPYKYLVRKFYLQAQKKPFDLRLGDFYATEGRGLVLSVLKNEEFGMDTSIQGEYVGLNLPYVNLNTLAGFVNPGDDITFTPERAKTPELPYGRRDQVWGGETVFEISRALKLGAHYVGTLDRVDPTALDADTEADNWYNLVSFSLEAPDIAGHGSFYAEYAFKELLDQRLDMPDLHEEGRGLYVALNMNFGDMDFLFEGKDYYKFTYPYSIPPSLEELELAFEPPLYDDEFAGRVRLGYRVPVIDSYVYVNYLQDKGHQLPPPDLKSHYDEGNKYKSFDRVKHFYAGMEHLWPNAAYVSAMGGYREEHLGRWLHSELNVTAPFTEKNSLAAIAEWRDYRGIGLFRDTSFGSELFSLTYSLAPIIDVSVQYEHSTEPNAGGSTGTLGGSSKKHDFYNIEAKGHPTPASTISVFWGSQKGGLKCSGGICREVPAFEGLRSEFTYHF